MVGERLFTTFLGETGMWHSGTIPLATLATYCEADLCTCISTLSAGSLFRMRLHLEPVHWRRALRS